MSVEILQSPNAPAGFPFLENHVRARLGIGKDEVRELRRQLLTEGAEWILKKKRVWLAQAAVDALLAAKRLDAATVKKVALAANADDDAALKRDGSDLQKKSAPKSEVIWLKVIQTTRNPHVIQCCPAEDSPIMPKKIVRVRVRTATNFRRHMELPATLVAGYTDLYDLTRACPKKPGKW